MTLPLPQFGNVWMTTNMCIFQEPYRLSKLQHVYINGIDALLRNVSVPQLVFLFNFRNLLPISHVCTEDGEKPMVLLPFMAWGNLKLFLRQCKLAEANNPQVRRQRGIHLVELYNMSHLLIMKINASMQVV